MRKVLILVLTVISIRLGAQEPMRVVRCEAIDYQTHVSNFTVDENNQKFASDGKQVWQIRDLAYAEPLVLQNGESSLLQFPDGNADIRWPSESLNKVLGDVISSDNPITSAQYHSNRKELWIGTLETGLFQLRAEPSLQLIEHFTVKNSKLKSDQINFVYIDQLGRKWVGTDDGIMVGKDGKWDLLERYFNFIDIAEHDSTRTIWLLADDLIGPVNRKMVWEPIEIPEHAVEGTMKLIDFDPSGNLWIGSELICRFNPATEAIDVYGGAQYYTSQFIASLNTDQDGAVWVGTEDKGLYLIEKESAMTVSGMVTQKLDCNNAATKATLDVRVTGGVPPFNYAWEGGLSGKSPSGLGPGTYVVSVTDARGKTKISKIEVEDPNVVASARMIKKESAIGAADGTAQVDVTQGRPGFKYRWDNGENTPKASKLSEGLHKVTVTDDDGCQTVVEVAMQRIIGDLAAIVETVDSLSCNGNQNGSIVARVEGGKGPFTYQWDYQNATTPELNGLKAGTYTVTVTDALKTTTTTRYTLVEPETLQAGPEIISPAATNQKNGSAWVAVQGGTAPFTFKWDNGEAADTAVALAPGIRTVTVTDAKGCTTVAELNMSENILPLGASIVQEGAINCFGEPTGAFQVTVKGGKGPYQYNWNKTTVSGNTGVNLRAGLYEVTVTDAVGQTTTTKLDLTEPQKIVAELSNVSPASTGAADGIVKVAVSGGTAPYQLTWDNGESGEEASKLAGGAHSLTVTDAGGCTETVLFEVTENILPLELALVPTDSIRCNGAATAAFKVDITGGKGPYKVEWSTGQTGNSIAGLASGDFDLTIEDALGTRKRLDFSVGQPSIVNAAIRNLEPATTDQADGKAEVTVSGGVAPYSYAWASGETTAKAEKLNPGAQQVTVTDANGCASTIDLEVSEDVKPLDVSITSLQPVQCRGDQNAVLEVKIHGGKGPFQYQWHTAELQGEKIENLSPGNYLLTVTDATGQESSTEFTIVDPDTLTGNIARAYPAAGTGEPDGRATAIANGGGGSYSFAWDNGEQEQTATRLSVGPHTVTVTDANGCAMTLSTEIGQRLIPDLALGKIERGQVIQMEAFKFEADSTSLMESMKPILDELYNFLNYNPSVVVEIAGHTNNLPQDDYCDRISNERAKSAANYVIKRGIPFNRVFYKGYGKREPIADNNTPEGRQKNQRIEIRILSAPKPEDP